MKIRIIHGNPGSENILIPLMGELILRGHIITEINPDAIISGAGFSVPEEKEAWILDIPTVVVVDNWINFKKRFIDGSCPSKICVVDNDALLNALKDGIPRDKLEVTGNPHFETILKNRKPRKILFIGEPITLDYPFGYWGFDEYTTCLSLINNCGNDVVYYKQHPREKIKAGIRLAFGNTLDIIYDYDIVVGMSSMVLLEALMIGRRVISYMPGLNRENPFILDKKGILKTITNEKELKIQLNGGFEFIPNSIDNIIKVIQGVASNA